MIFHKRKPYLPLACCLAIVYFFFCFSAMSQQPMGVEGTKIWYVTLKKGNYSYLRDTSGNNLSLPNRSSLRNVNFHPAYWMTKNERILDNVAFNQVTLAAAFFPKKDAVNEQLFVQSTFLKNTFLLKNNQVASNINERKYSYGNVANRSTLEVKGTTRQENAMKTAVYYFASGKTYHNVWGEEKQTALLTNFEGYLPELILYNRVLNPLEKSKVESYLSIKYGTTLDSSYIGRNGDILWNIHDTILNKFHNRVCAIGKDTLAAIFQPRSNTTYEEEFDNITSFNKDANDSSIISSWRYIPVSDQPSLYRSVTIGFTDETLRMLKEGSYIFWGDNSLSIKPNDFIERYKSQYPNLKSVKRNWLIFNPDKLSQPLKIAVAGGDYQAETLYNTLYDPYDYQLYRFVIIKNPEDKSAKIERPILCSYFGREQNTTSLKFNTRTIIWDSLSFTNKSGYNYFSFGKVPILNFLILNNQFDNRKTILEYPYYQDSAIRSATHFDTTVLVFDYAGRDSIVNFSFKTSIGVGNLKAKIYLLYPNGQKVPLPDSFILNNQLLADSSTNEKTQVITEDAQFEIMPPGEDNPSNIPGGAKPKTKYIKRTVPADKQKFKEFQVRIPLKNNLNLQSRFLIEVTDDLNQLTTLPLKIRKPK